MPSREDRAWADYSARFRREVLPKLLSSIVFMSIGSEATRDFDVRQATELGAALLMDKPVLLVIPAGRTISTRLRRVADAVVDDWRAEDEASQDRLFAAMKRLGIKPN